MAHSDPQGRHGIATPSPNDKRERTSPTGDTPRQREKRRPMPPARRPLHFSGAAGTEWTKEEDSALVEFILLHQRERNDKWPGHKDWRFWNASAAHVKAWLNSAFQRSGKPKHLRTKKFQHQLYFILPCIGSACHCRVMAVLNKLYATPKVAEAGLPRPLSRVSEAFSLPPSLPDLSHGKYY